MPASQSVGDGEGESALPFTLQLAAAGSNRNTGCVASLPSRGLVAYGAGGCVVLLADAGRTVLEALPLHRYAVSGVALVEDGCGTLHVLAASAGGGLACWARRAGAWTHCFERQAHKGPAVALAACWAGNRGLLIASAGFDAFLRLWTYSGSGSELLEASSCDLRATGGKGASNSLPECVALCSDVHCGGALVAVGGTTECLQLYTTDGDLSHLQLACELHGHGDWIRHVTISPLQLSGVRYIATGSKDCSARIWTLRQDAVCDDGEDDEYLGPPRASFEFSGNMWRLCASALLREHSKAVQGVAFSAGDKLRLATASMDCTIALWEVDDDGWTCGTKFGLLGGAGAHALGFFGVAFASLDCRDVVGNNFGGTLHRWHNEAEGKGGSATLMDARYVADSVPGGHFDAVNDIDWDESGRYLLTCSQDKTVRLFLDRGEQGFAEAARPQTHGHAVHAVAVCDVDGMRYVSGSEESMLRMFAAPTAFVKAAGIDGDGKVGSKLDVASTAEVPELGLSNKAVYEGHDDDVEKDAAGGNVTSFGAGRADTAFPLELDLKQHTLWPEDAKLYGHGNNISCVAVSLERGVIASASYAQQPKEGGIRVWSGADGRQLQHLLAHELTITRLAFSLDGACLLSVSRDRSFAIHRYREDELQLVHRETDAHTRQVYDGAWLFGCTAIATCGRDKRLRLFAVGAERCGELQTIGYDVAPCAVAVREEGSHNSVLAVGFEDGSIRLLRVKSEGESEVCVQTMGRVARRQQCSSRVTRLQWRHRRQQAVLQRDLAVASEDSTVRVLRHLGSSEN